MGYTDESAPKGIIRNLLPDSNTVEVCNFPFLNENMLYPKCLTII